MGPRSGERGNTLCFENTYTQVTVLQWGRAQVSAEIHARSRGQLLRAACFNGAALR